MSFNAGLVGVEMIPIILTMDQTVAILKDLIELRERISKDLEMLDSIIETLEIMADKELMESLRRADEDVKAGRVRPFEEFLKELDEEV